jgi:hypothetical protein
MKMSGKETLLLALVAILWVGMAILYWPVALIFLILIAIRAPGERARKKAAPDT